MVGRDPRRRERGAGECRKIGKRLYQAKRPALLALLLLGATGVRSEGGLRAQEAEPHRHLPVLLVPGWLGKAEELTALRDRFLRDGWEEDEVMTLEFQDPVGSNLDHAVELERAIEELKERTGSSAVDAVAHSMGGLALWALLQEKGGRVPLRRVVFLGSPLQGTLTAHLAWGEGGREMRPGSEFLKELEEGRRPQAWIEVLTIRTPVDLNVLPGEGGTLPGMNDRVVCCPTHQGLLDHEETFQIARAFLLGGFEEEDGTG